MLFRSPDIKGKTLGKWEVPKEDMGDDSAVVIYWEPKELRAGETRELGFTYGLGSLSHKAGNLSVTVAGATYKGGELTVLALVGDPKAKFATLELPPGLKLAQGEMKQQSVATVRGRPSPVSWRVVAEQAGKYNIIVSTDVPNLSRSRRVTITANSLFQ